MQCQALNLNSLDIFFFSKGAFKDEGERIFLCKICHKVIKAQQNRTIGGQVVHKGQKISSNQCVPQNVQVSDCKCFPIMGKIVFIFMSCR